VQTIDQKKDKESKKASLSSEQKNEGDSEQAAISNPEDDLSSGSPKLKLY